MTPYEQHLRSLIREEIAAAKIALIEKPWTIKQVAQHFSTTQTTVHRWRRERDPRVRLRMYNIGSGEERGIWRVDWKEIERFTRERGL